VRLKVASVRGCFSADSIKVLRLSSKPKPRYVVPEISCVSKEIEFKDVSSSDTGVIKKWRWNFDTSAASIEDTVSTSHKIIYKEFGPRKNQTHCRIKYWMRK